MEFRLYHWLMFDKQTIPARPWLNDYVKQTPYRLNIAMGNDFKPIVKYLWIISDRQLVKSREYICRNSTEQCKHT